MQVRAATVATSVVMFLLSGGCSDGHRSTATAPSVSGSLFISSVSPRYGSSAESTIITIRGSGFAAGATVSIGAVTVPATFVGQASLTAAVPAQPAGVHDVTVTNHDGASATLRSGFQFMVGISAEHVPITIAGQILVEDSDSPVARAAVRLVGSRTAAPVPPQSDDDGRFVLEGTISRDAETLSLSVAAENAGSWSLFIPRATAAAAVVRVPELIIRAGKQLTSAMNFSNALSCTFEDVPCRRLFVDGPPGSRIDLELVAEAGQQVGLFVQEPFRAPSDYPKRVTVSPSQIWIMGAGGTFTIKAPPAGD